MLPELQTLLTINTELRKPMYGDTLKGDRRFKVGCPQIGMVVKALIINKLLGLCVLFVTINPQKT